MPRLHGSAIAASTTLWMAIGLAASVWLVRRLGLPLWWVLFPPLTHAIWNGNPQTVMLALLVAGTAAAGALAAAVKLYAVLPLAFHPRRLAFALIALAVTLPLLPWSSISTADTASDCALRLPGTAAPGGSRCCSRRPCSRCGSSGGEGGEWFSVPAVFPATQFYYVSTALPALVGRPAIAALLALPVPLLTPVVVIVLAVGAVAGPLLERRGWRIPQLREGSAPV